MVHVFARCCVENSVRWCMQAFLSGAAHISHCRSLCRRVLKQITVCRTALRNVHASLADVLRVYVSTLDHASCCGLQLLCAQAPARLVLQKVGGITDQWLQCMACVCQAQQGSQRSSSMAWQWAVRHDRTKLPSSAPAISRTAQRTSSAAS